MGAIEIHRFFHVELHYRVLCALDLRRDAASLYAGPVQKPWVAPLLKAYLGAPGRLLVQGLALMVRDLAALRHELAGDRYKALADEAGRALAARMAEALEAEAPAAMLAFRADERPSSERLRRIDPWLPALERLHASAWKRAAPTDPPPLDVIDCPSLQTREGTHGRGVLWSGRMRVAVALGAELEQALCQLIHEAIHPVTDPPIRAAFGSTPHDTRAGSPSFELHRRLEVAAVETGQRLIEEHLPQLVPAYSRWRRRFGM